MEGPTEQSVAKMLAEKVDKKVNELNHFTMKIYGFFHSDCVYESAPRLVSMHYTKAGAYKAMKRYLFDKYEEWRRRRREWKFGDMEHWFIDEVEVLP